MDMELLDLLEDRITTLISELEQCRSEHKNTLEELESVTAARDELEEENRTLKESLEQQQNVQEEIGQRVDHLLTMMDNFDAPQ